MKKKNLVSLFAAAALSISLVLPANAADFSDIPDEYWGKNAIEAAVTAGLMNGDGDGSFRPETPITRAEFLKVLTASIGKNIDMNNTSGLNHWAAPYYNYALEKYLVPNTEENVSLSNGAIVQPGVLSDETADFPIERWEMAYLVWQGVDNYLPADENLELVFNDKEQIINRYPAAIQTALANVTDPNLYLFQGDENNNFNAGSHATRAEAAALMVRANEFFDFARSIFEPETTPNITFIQGEEHQNMAGHSFATVTMKNGGTFKIELMPEFAPETVENFISLAESGFYNGLTFHRIVDGFMAQGGDPQGNGMGGSDKMIKGEFAANGFTQNNLSHTRGVISMARSQSPDSASSQFFICYDDASFLNGQYAAFGMVVEGMEVVDGFLNVERTTNSMGEKATPSTPIVIQSITISK